MIKLKRINMDYGKQKVIRNFSVEVNEGDFLTITGPSGSGKTTLLKIMSGLLKPDDGLVLVNNTKIYNMKKRKLSKYRFNNFGYVFQGQNLVPSITVKDNLLIGQILSKQSVDMKYLVEITQYLKISKILSKYPMSISGGEAQRVAIARAIINKPKIIFADEPTGNLDSKSSLKVARMFADVSDYFKTTIVLVTHDDYVASFGGKTISISNYDGVANE